MCGIFAYTGPDRPDPDLLTEAAAGAARRGPHGYGWAGTGLRPYRRQGPMDLSLVRDLNAPRILGHARLASFGAAHDDDRGLQPAEADGHLLAHNGNAYNSEELSPGAPTDSAALVRAYAAHRRLGGLDPASALQAVIDQADQRAWAIVILDTSGLVLAHRRNLPLWRHEDLSGVYLSSRHFRNADPLQELTVHSEDAR